MEEIVAPSSFSLKDNYLISADELSENILFRSAGIEIFSLKGLKELELTISDCQEEPSLNMYFSLQGISSAKPISSGQEYHVEPNRHILGYMPNFEGDYSLRGNRVETFGICMQEPYFERLIATDLPCLERFWNEVHAGREADISRGPMPITHQQHTVINEILACPYIGQMRRLYLESKVTELFFLQAQQAESMPEQPFLFIKPADIERLHAAKLFVQQHIFDPLTLKQIAREIGLNDFKLKKGFKQLFGCTVFDYLMQCRMEYARQILLDTHSTIAEVAYTLGYADPYNFTKAFKRYFGYLPSQL